MTSPFDKPELTEASPAISVSSKTESHKTPPLPNAHTLSTKIESWGVVGTTFLRYVASGKCEVVRTDIGENVEVPKAAIFSQEGLHWQKRLGGEVVLFHKAGSQFPLGELATFRSLVEYRAENLAKWQKIPTNEAEVSARQAALAELDAIVQHLIELVVMVHQNRGNVGLLTPAGVLIHGSIEKLSIFLCDAGFRCKQSGDSDYPTWWEEQERARHEWGNLIGTADLVEAQAASSSSQAELFKIVRIIIWLLTGQQHQHVAEVRWTDRTPAAVWQILEQVDEGKISTAQELHENLQGGQAPSWHFRVAQNISRPESQTPAHKRGPIGIVVLAVLALLGGVGWFTFFPPQRGEEAATGNTKKQLLPNVVPGTKPSEDRPPTDRIAQETPPKNGPQQPQPKTTEVVSYRPNDVAAQAILNKPKTMAGHVLVVVLETSFKTEIDQNKLDSSMVALTQEHKDVLLGGEVQVLRPTKNGSLELTGWSQRQTTLDSFPNAAYQETLKKTFFYFEKEIQPRTKAQDKLPLLLVWFTDSPPIDAATSPVPSSWVGRTQVVYYLGENKTSCAAIHKWFGARRVSHLARLTGLHAYVDDRLRESLIPLEP